MYGMFIYIWVFLRAYSMYGIFTYIWVFLGANVGKYSIHGAYGYIYICFGSVLRTYFPYVPLAKIYFPLILVCLAVCLQGACRHRFPRLPNRKSPEVGGRRRKTTMTSPSLDWFTGTCTGNHDFYFIWLVVSTHLKNIGQLGLLFPIYIYIYTYGKKCSKTTNQSFVPIKNH